MQKPKIKIDKYKFARIGVWLLFAFALLYGAYYVNGVRIKVAEQTPAPKTLHVTKIDQAALGVAAQRYNTGLFFSFQEGPITDPFALNIKASAPAGQ